MSRWFVKANANKVSIKIDLKDISADERVRAEKTIQGEASNNGCTILVQTTDNYDYITIEGEKAKEVADKYLQGYPERITLADENIDITPGEEIVKKETETIVD